MQLTAPTAASSSTTASRFIKTAVARKHLDSAWSMLGPEMKAGQTRKSWDTGNNNVIPFQAIGIATWDILYAYQDDVALDLGVVGDKHSDWAGKTFTIEFKRYSASAQLARRVVGAEGHRRRRASQERRVSTAPPPPTVAHCSREVAPRCRSAILGGCSLTLVGVGDPERGAAAPRRAALRASCSVTARARTRRRPARRPRSLGGTVRQQQPPPCA